MDWKIELPEEPAEEGLVKCTFCNSTRVPTHAAFAAPEGEVYICHDCVRLGAAQIDPGTDTPAELENPRKCSFCQRQQEFADEIFSAPQGAYVCTECLTTFAEKVQAA